MVVILGIKKKERRKEKICARIKKQIIVVHSHWMIRDTRDPAIPKSEATSAEG